MIKDQAFIRGKVPMTKEEIRCISIAKLDLQATDIMLDIGAGSGSVSIEASRAVERVYSIECNIDGIEIIEKNKEKFAAKNVEIIFDKAPQSFPQAKISKVFIGGTRGQMTPIFQALEVYPIKKIVINTITIENTYLAIEALKEFGYKTEVISVNISKSHHVGHVTMMKALNPIHIITGEKQ